MLARATSDFVEQRRLWRFLASSGDEALARRTLDLTLGDAIPRQIRTQIVQIVAGSHPRLAWDFFMANRPALEGMLDPLQRLEYAASLAGQSSDPEIADAIIAYGQGNASTQEITEATASSIRQRSQITERTMPAVDAWIARHTPPAPRRRR
jgi:aminopeptidase N